MMKTIVRSVLISAFAMVAAPAYAAEAWQAFDCELVGEKTEADVIAAAQKWLKAARTMKGGEEMQVSIHFPVAAASGGSDFKMILKAPSFKAWGTFWDGYKGSPAHKVDEETDEITECPSARLFEGVVIKVE